MRPARLAVILLGLVLVLGVGNYAIWQRHRVADSGRTLLLELRPVDPRSLIQGDYMALAYDDRAFPDGARAEQMPRRGRVVLSLDEDGVGSFARLDTGGPLAPHELRLSYKLRLDSGELRYGAESFLFQEGQADLYADARYGILRVGPDGTSVLIGLADADRRRIVPSPVGHDQAGH
jgi:uncharacterized membrane-anchored protein